MQVTYTPGFFNENVCILIEISLKFDHKGPFEKTSALVYQMAWHLTAKTYNLDQC